MRAEAHAQGEPRLSSLSLGDWLEILKRAVRSSLDDNVPMIASAVAYGSFFAIPSVLLLVVGLFGLFSGPDTVAELRAKTDVKARAGKGVEAVKDRTM